MKVAFITVGDTSRLTGGYLYCARVFDRLGEFGVEVAEVVPCGASAAEQKAASARLADFDPRGCDVVVVDALARVVAAPFVEGWRKARPVVAMVHELPSVAAPENDVEEERAFEDALLGANLLIAVSGHGKSILERRGVSAERIRIVSPGFDGIEAEKDSSRHAPSAPEANTEERAVSRTGMFPSSEEVSRRKASTDDVDRGSQSGPETDSSGSPSRPDAARISKASMGEGVDRGSDPGFETTSARYSALSGARRRSVVEARTSAHPDVMRGSEGEGRARNISDAVRDSETGARTPTASGDARSARGEVRASLPGTLRAICVSQWIPRKGILELVEAWRMANVPNASLELVGETEADPEYRSRVMSAIGEESSVSVSGKLDDGSLAAAYAESDIFILPSRFEGYGIVFAEALSFGLPVVACDAGPVPEVVGEEAGIFVSPEDAEGLSRAILTLLSDKDLRRRMSEAALRRAKELPRWDDTARGFANVLREAVYG